MKLTADYHTHTPYSHGKGTVDENAARAKALGLKQLGITDHGFAQLAFGLRRGLRAASPRLRWGLPVGLMVLGAALGQRIEVLV